MRKNLKLLVTMFSVVGALALTGCGETEEKSDTIKIGVQADLSGDVASPYAVHGVLLAVKEINEAGGINGKQIEAIVVDTQSDTTRYQEMAKKLVLEDEVDVMFGSGTSAAREAMRPIFEENETLYIYPTIYEGGVASKYLFCLGPTPEQTTAPLMEYASENIGKKVYLVTADYNYGHICAQWIKKYAEDFGMEIIGEEYIPLGVSQFSSTISNIQSANPDIIYGLLVGSAQKSFYDQWAVSGDGTPIISDSNIIGDNYYNILSAPVLAGAMGTVTYNQDLDIQEMQDFAARYKAEYPDDNYCSFSSQNNYDAVYLWAEAVKKAGTSESNAVIAAFESGEISITSKATGSTIAVDAATHHASMPVFLAGVNEDHSLTLINQWDSVTCDWLKNTVGVDLTKEDPKFQYTLENFQQ